MSPTVALDIMTGVLAVATVILAVASWRSVQQAGRLQKKRDDNRQEALFRAVLVEQMENCRQLIEARPQTDRNKAAELGAFELAFVRVEELLGSAPLPLAMVERLLAQRELAVAGVREVGTLVYQWRAQWPAAGGPPLDCDPAWAKAVVLVQAIGLLVRAQAEVAGLTEVASEFRGSAWLEATDLSRGELHLWEQQHRSHGVPPWPTGHPAYDACAPDYRGVEDPNARRDLPVSTPIVPPL